MAAYNPKFFDLVFQSWDMSFKEDGTSRVCGLVVGSRRHPGSLPINRYGDIYVLDCVVDYMSFERARAEVVSLSERHPAAYFKVVEEKANGPAIISSLTSLIGGFIAWPPKGTQMRGKIERWHAASPPQRARNCFLPAGEPWVEEFRANMGHLPHGTPNDEGDAFSQAVDFIWLDGANSTDELLKW